MMKRIFSVFLALITLLCATVIGVDAADVPKADTAAAFDTAETGAGVIYFDAGSAGWENAGSIRFYIRRALGSELAPRDSADINGVKGDDNIWSFQASKLGMVNGVQYSLTLINGTSSAETYPLLMDTFCYGDTVYATGKKLESPDNYRRQSTETRWRNSSLAPQLRISPAGNAVGEAVPTATTKHKILVNYLASGNSDGLKNTLNLTGKSAQSAIDNTAKGLGLSKSNVKQAISDAKVSGHSVTGEKADWSGQWNASDSSLPIGTLNVVPALKASLETDGVRLSWTAIEDVNRYRIYYKYSGKWYGMAKVLNDTTYLDTDVRPGYRYSYTIRGMTSDWSDYVTSYSDVGITITYFPAPTFSLSAAADGVKISWNNLYAAKYRVYRKNGSSWKKLGDTTATSYIDTAAPSGTTCTYTVRCVNKEGTAFTSAYRAGQSIKFVAAPVFSLSNAADSLKISWNAVSGTEKYRIYRKNGGSWVKLSDTAETSYADTTVQSGTTYTYTVRCINAAGNAFTSTYRDGKSLKFITAPVFNLSNAASGVKVSWSASKGAEKYRVYRKNGSSWVKLTDTAATSYVDKTAKSGTTYTYTVRCINAKGTSFTSSYRTGKSIKFIAAPVISLSKTSSGVKISWKAVNGAEKYRVYRKNGSKWVKLTDTAATSYVDKTVKSGTTYTYTARCINAKGTSFTSNYRTGKSIKYTR